MILVVVLASMLLSTTVFTSSSLIQPANAQQLTQPQEKAPLNFYLKLANNASTSQAASNSTGTKNITIAVDIQKGPGGQPTKLPITAVVPASIQPQDLQLCASLANGSESCQPLAQQGASIDLTQSSAGVTTAPTGTMTPMQAPAPQSYPGDNNEKASKAFFQPIFDSLTRVFAVQDADAQLISVEDTTINIPITVIIPINLNIQNAQICASVASSGSQTCQQIVLNPVQMLYSPVDVNLAQPTPAVTMQATPTTTPASTPTPTATTTPVPTTTAIPAPQPTTTPAPAETPNPEQQPQPMPPEITTEEQPSTSEDQAAEPTEEGGSGEATSGEGGSAEGGN
jgi:hypothetical protein